MAHFWTHCCLALGLVQAGNAWAAHAYAQFGDIPYPAGFSHFAYVNPAAPKGGEIMLVPPTRQSNFDKYNPFTLKGSAPPSMLGMMFDTLLVGNMDEPTTALTRKEIKRLFEVVEQIKARGVATVFVSHKIDEIQEICNTITILRNGEVVGDGLMKDFKRDKISQAMTGLNVSETRIAPKLKKTSKKVVEIKNFTTKPTFSNISFSIAPGEILGMTGLLGSGRTELAEAIFGQYPVDSGEIIVDGKPIHVNSSSEALKAGIGYVPPDRLTQGLFLEQSILNNLVAVGIDQYQSRGGRLSKSRLAQAGERWIKDLRIKTNNPQNPVTSLSGGNQQRVVLAKWLAMNPHLMILNGPTVGVDIGSKREILKIIRDRAQEGMAFLVISDDIPELVQICHRVIVIKSGQISKEFSEAELDEKVLYKELS